MNKILIILLLIVSSVNAQLITNNSLSPEDLIKNVLVGRGVNISNVTFTGNTKAIGQFVGVNSNIGVDNGVILSTGTVLDNVLLTGQKNGPIGPNNNPSSGTVWNENGDNDLESLVNKITYDAAVLEFDFVPQGDTVEFEYVFASEEYLEEVDNVQFNDVFAFFISGPGIAGVTNLAIVPGTSTEISVGTINNVSNSNLYINNGTGNLTDNEPEYTDATVVNFNGFTVPLKAVSKVQPCKSYHLKIAIADCTDKSFDSGVFLKGGSLTSNPQFEPKQETSVDIGSENLIPEGCSNGILKISRTENLWDNLTIEYRVLGDAENGVDYNTLSGSVSFPANATTTNVTIVPINDAILEPDESVILRFPNPNVCLMDSLDYTYNITELLPINSHPDSADIVCPGEDVVINSNFSGGFGPYLYSWDNGDDLISTKVSPLVDEVFEFTVVDACGTSTSNDFKVTVPNYSALSINLGEDTTVGCSGVNIDLTPSISGGSGGYVFDWASGESLFSISPQITKTKEFILKVTDDCLIEASDSVTVILDYPEFTVKILNDTVVCPGDSVEFSIDVTGGISPYVYIWENGRQNSVAVFASDESRFIKISVSDSCGIIPAKDSVELAIQKPSADFFITSSRKETDEIIYFRNNSEGGVESFSWNFGNGVNSTDEHTNTVYTTDSTYVVNLEVTDSSGCKDHITKLLKIIPPLYFYVPNCFTPNDDGLNDFFLVKGIGIKAFNLTIFDKWGVEVFGTNDINSPWYGTSHTDKEMPVGVYVYKITLEGESGDDVERLGTITLLR